MNKHLFKVTFCRQHEVNRGKPLSGIEHKCSLLKKVDRQLDEYTHTHTSSFVLIDDEKKMKEENKSIS